MDNAAKPGRSRSTFKIFLNNEENKQNNKWDFVKDN